MRRIGNILNARNIHNTRMGAVNSYYFQWVHGDWR